MSGIIRITPTDLRQCASQCRSFGQEQEELIARTQSLIDNLRNQWEGKASASYADQFARLRPSYDRIRETYEYLSKQLDDSATIMESADADIARQLDSSAV